MSYFWRCVGATVATVTAVAIVGSGATPALAENVDGTDKNVRQGTTATIGYNCDIPDFGWDDYCATFWVQPGQVVDVFLDQSGEQTVDFNLNDIATGQQYNPETLSLEEGATGNLWTNDLPHPVNVRMPASAVTPVSVEAFGSVNIYYP